MDMNGMYGRFIPGTAGYEINRLNLPTNWDYIYQNRDMLLKVDQFGPVYAQAYPPGDILLFKRENLQRFSNWAVWFTSEQFEAPFTNFFRPLTDRRKPSLEPDKLTITFRPECAVYEFEHEGLAVKTVFSLPVNGTEIIMKCTVINLRSEPLRVKAFPFLVPYVNQAQITAWDKYEWYLKTACGRCQDQFIFWTQLMDNVSVAENRRTAVFWTDADGLTGTEISLEKFIGNGSIENPEQIMQGRLRMKPSEAAFGDSGPDNSVAAITQVYAQQYEYVLPPGKEKILTQVLTMPANNKKTRLPGVNTVKKSARYFNSAFYNSHLNKVKIHMERIFTRNRIKTGDEMFDYYANYWLPMQMEWVSSLDRGWPAGMRGTRDAAQDYTALLHTGAYEECRGMLVTMLSCQRTDGWMLRQFSAKGRKGAHDYRAFVDAGAFTLEFIWMYLAHTGDFELLDHPLPWLDSDEEHTVLEHAIQMLEYYLKPENNGEHGLCKIGEGDWLDSVNRAGVKGRGESVFVSMQTVMSLGYMADILKRKTGNEEKIERYEKRAIEYKANILKAAFNKKEFFNGTFSDAGQWVFSDQDPDGEERPYGPVNWYAVIAGIVKGWDALHLLNLSERLKGPCGYRLYTPPLGLKPFEGVGRAASGDAFPYFAENGNVYNHGSQGFLTRAMSVAGNGDGLFDCLQYILPYDQEKHPTDTAMSAPYAITNCWQELPVFTGRTLFTFLTGSVAMALRGIYEWMLGIQPNLDGLMIDPCLPRAFGTVEAQFEYRGKRVNLVIVNNAEAPGLILNGKPVAQDGVSPVSGRARFVVRAEELEDDNLIEVAVMSMDLYHQLVGRHELNKLLDEGLEDITNGLVEPLDDVLKEARKKILENEV